VVFLRFIEVLLVSIGFGQRAKLHWPSIAPVAS
jgi:hypothetical protein